MSAWGAGTIAAALVAPIWAGRIYWTPQFAYVFPRPSRLARLAGIVWLAAVLACWCFLPTALPWLAFMSASVLAITLGCDLLSWRGTRGTPPGRLAILDGIQALADQDYYLRCFERYGPVFKMSQYGTPTICVLGLGRIEKLIKGHSEDLGPSTLPISRSVEGSFLRYMPPELHVVYGRLFRRAMAGPYSTAQRQWVDQICEQQMRSLVGCETSPYPALQAIARLSLNYLLLGLDTATSEGQRFDELASGFARAGIGSSLRQRDEDAFEEMRRILARKVEADAAESVAADADSVLVRLKRQDPAMPDRVCLDNLIVMHRIATGNVSSLLAWMLYRWAAEPTIVDEIRAGDADNTQSLLRLFLAETLRTSQSEYLYRRVVREFEFEGHRYPRGWLVRGCVWESHRTAEAIEDPAAFRLRRGSMDYDRKQFTPFGMGAHACNGADVNEVICLAFLSQLLAMSSVRAMRAEPLQRQMRHWSHWQPNQAMRVSLGGRS
jgi:cytochrome P450